MYVDASALTAILKNEPERAAFIAAIDEAGAPITSVVSAFEAAIAVSTLTGSCSSAASEVARFLAQSKVEVLAINGACLTELAQARDRYGKGSGHPANLNLGDCFSYAIARMQDVGLLYKGNDFARTDLA